jgi:secreted protein with Ig-like and vWFA domain
MNIRQSLKFIGVGLIEMAKISAVIAMILSIVGLIYFFFGDIGIIIALGFIFIIFTAYNIGQIYVITDVWKSEK